ncbi:MAG: hypothetical protein HQ526_07260 [Actinobacteria bacterium]|nr:hypothetical protein [Actinomycetota bacterium]
MSSRLAGQYQAAVEEEWGEEIIPTVTKPATPRVDAGPPDVSAAPAIDIRDTTPQAKKTKRTKKATGISTPPAGTWILLCPEEMGAYLDGRDPKVSAIEVLIRLMRHNTAVIRDAFAGGAAYANKPPGTKGRAFRPGRPVRYPVKLSTEQSSQLRLAMDDIFDKSPAGDRPKSPIHAAIVAYELRDRAAADPRVPHE